MKGNSDVEVSVAVDEFEPNDAAFQGTKKSRFDRSIFVVGGAVAGGGSFSI
jgi:hypothetical protein